MNLGDVSLNAAQLNQHCFCVATDRQRLAQALDQTLGVAGLAERIATGCPHLFAANPVFVEAREMRRMAAVIQAIEQVAAQPAWQEEVLARAPEVARLGSGGPAGVFFGYDFHLTQGRLGLIEINSNAGGALLNAALTHAQAPCCESVGTWLPPQLRPGELEAQVLAMFRREWALGQVARPLRRIAIVDESPATQYLYPEFLLFQALFRRAGWQAHICDPGDLQFTQGELRLDGERIDLVYNRLTDFSFSAPASAALRTAWQAQAAVITPHPRAHALLADKRNLVLLSDDAWLASVGVDETSRALLHDAVPRTRLLRPADAERLWAQRRQLFFKPADGFGSRAAYRGDKLTRRVWEQILTSGPYVVQELVQPGERMVHTPPGSTTELGLQSLKMDLRNYSYAGEVMAVAARLYQGQTTNFRTPGGGFAAVQGVGC
jgi:hypothetical protein